MTTRKVMIGIGISLVLISFLPRMFGVIREMHEASVEKRDNPSRAKNLVSEVPPPTLPTSVSNFIFPGEVREYDTNFERVGTDSGGTVLLQVYVVRGDGTGKWVPVTSTKKWQRDLDGETWAKDSPYMIWDVGLYKVTNRLRAKVPRDCEGSSFTLRYKER